MRRTLFAGPRAISQLLVRDNPPRWLFLRIGSQTRHVFARLVTREGQP
ncbi:hypothetical protein AKJ09_09271 [Labilithrix luteola]|uniref:Uncharacterized protein n=1 Tax=Labilithrix luteola TaxID=1391654 RepID=A0A0K1QA46_9BACT|nr:hypothetical protein AKJ09_09271 [Labilithrix luteola]